MAQFAWPAFTKRRHDLHLVVAHAPASVCEDLAALMKLLIERLQPEGDFALSSEETGSETVLFCAFERAGDASVLIDALSAQEANKHPGWASEFHCSIDKATVSAVGRKRLP
ncbi:hypothetical protein [Enhydrobacter sp.]|jgi:hypothetical protein|uniref:hypothetical protein n=1 Tax=Enhydrobacter sp. TaxID=1894999 RepID=UPI002607EF71|nr:hypothetical protein [Enhydrobacter sp.]WIM10041.1 MAG: hypothetical protein OJF58_000994 [Enhydrobacter sp.]